MGRGGLAAHALRDSARGLAGSGIERCDIWCDQLLQLSKVSRYTGYRRGGTGGENGVRDARGLR